MLEKHHEHHNIQVNNTEDFLWSNKCLQMKVNDYQ